MSDALNGGRKISSPKQGGRDVHHPLPPGDNLDSRAVHRRAHRLRNGPLKELFPNSADGYLKVHHQGAHEADVTEGGGGVWERLHYDWSDPNHIKLTTTDSNMFGGASGYTYTLRRQPDRTTDVDVVIVREGKNLRGRVLAGVLGTIGKRSLGKAFAHSVKAIEARNDASVA